MTPVKNMITASITTVDIAMSVGILRTVPVDKYMKRIGKKYIPAIMSNITAAVVKNNNGLLSLTVN